MFNHNNKVHKSTQEVVYCDFLLYHVISFHLRRVIISSVCRSTNRCLEWITHLILVAIRGEKVWCWTLDRCSLSIFFSLKSLKRWEAIRWGSLFRSGLSWALSRSWLRGHQISCLRVHKLRSYTSFMLLCSQLVC